MPCGGPAVPSPAPQSPPGPKGLTAVCNPGIQKEKPKVVDTVIVTDMGTAGKMVCPCLRRAPPPCTPVLAQVTLNPAGCPPRPLPPPPRGAGDVPLLAVQEIPPLRWQPCAAQPGARCGLSPLLRLCVMWVGPQPVHQDRARL